MNTSKNVKIKKPHKCFACFREFPKGSVMEKWSGLYDGEWNHGYSCLTCVDIMRLDRSGEGFHEGFVNDWLDKGETPEQLLESERKRLIKLAELQKANYYE